MRVKILLRVDGKLPVSYSYYFGSYIVRSIARENEEVAAQLHNASPFKPYHFSRLLARPARVENGFLYFKRNSRATVYIASVDDEIALSIIDAVLTHGAVRVWKRVYSVEGVERVDYPKNPLNYETLSPIYISITEDGRKRALSPEDPLFHEELVQNIVRKYHFFTGKRFRGKITVTYDSVRPRMRYVKRTPLPCYDVRGTIKGDEEIIKLIWDVGLGEKNALGFGMVGHADVRDNG